MKKIDRSETPVSSVIPRRQQKIKHLMARIPRGRADDSAVTGLVKGLGRPTVVNKLCEHREIFLLL
jgi:hypothetical protein